MSAVEILARLIGWYVVIWLAATKVMLTLRALHIAADDTSHTD